MAMTLYPNVVRHKKRGTEYLVVGEGILQHENKVVDETPVTIYLDQETNQIWVRPTKEFADGRFEVISYKRIP